MVVPGEKAVCARSVSSLVLLAVSHHHQPYLFYDEKLPYDAARAANEMNRCVLPYFPLRSRSLSPAKEVPPTVSLTAPPGPAQPPPPSPTRTARPTTTPAS